VNQTRDLRLKTTDSKQKRGLRSADCSLQSQMEWISVSLCFRASSTCEMNWSVNFWTSFCDACDMSSGIVLAFSSFFTCSIAS